MLKIVEKFGLPYQLTPSATCIEGEWHEIMPLIRQCHERARKDSAHIVTFIKLEEDDGERTNCSECHIGRGEARA